MPMVAPIVASVPRMPRGIWLLGCVILLMDISSEMVHSLLPLFMVTSLGTSVLLVGLIEGRAEAAYSQFTRERPDGIFALDNPINYR